MDLTYLDSNATTMPAPEAVEAMLPYLREFWGNPSSAHRFGQRARQGIDVARQQIAELVGCDINELIFTGGGTESVNTAVRSLLGQRSPRRKIITSTVEHSATRELCNQLELEGYEIVRIEVDRNGELDFGQFVAAVDDATALCTMMWANNETGVIFPIQQIVEICHSCHVPFHTDATQAVGKVVVNMHQAGVDCASFASHKFHGPKGVGALYVRKGVRLRPLMIGGPQERSRRGGTENVAGIVGMGQAAEMAVHSLTKMDGVRALRDRLESTILSAIEDTHVNGSRTHRLPNTSNIGFAGLQSEAILLLLSEQGICASAGAACSSGSLEPSHVMRALGVPERIAFGAVRFSLSRYTTEAEIDRVLEALPLVIGKLRAVMPVGA